MESADDGSSAPWERPARWLGDPIGGAGHTERVGADGDADAAGSAFGVTSDETAGVASGMTDPAGAAERGDAGPDETPGNADDGAHSHAPDETPDAAETTGRRRRYADDDDDTAVRASELIAALSRETGYGTGNIGENVVPAGPAMHADRPRSGWLTTGRVLVAVFAVLLLVVAGTEWVIKARADAVLADNQVSALDTDDTNISPTTAPPVTDAAPGAPAPVSKHYQAENILLLGSDSRASTADAALGGANKDPGGSDVVMIAHLSADRSHVTVVSIPRDTYVNAPTCKAWDHTTNKQRDVDYSSPYSIWRINSTYAAGGPPCTVKAVQEMTGLRIDRVIIIDFSGFAAIVDAQGGIDVNACKPIIDGQLGTVLPVAGMQHIDGKQALNLVRARKVEGDSTSDLARINRQQKVLSTILRQATSTGVLLNPVKLNNVLQAFVRNVKTDNVTLDNLLDIAQSLGNLDPRRVTFFTLPTVPDSNGVGLHPTDGAELIWEALRADTALPGEVTEPVTPTTTAAAPTTPTTPMTTITPAPVTSLVTSLVTTTPSAPQRLSVAPGAVDLQVVNVAGRPAVANQARDALMPVGFDIASNDMLRPDSGTQTAITIEYSASNRAAALTVAAAIPGAKLVEKSGLGKQVRLMLGSSFNASQFAGAVRTVASGDPLPSGLSSSVAPVVSTVTSTVVSTPPPTTLPVTTSTSTSTSTPETTGQTLGTSDVTSVNAGSAGCI
jgi:LCP family protein required for cell wall assembly